MTQDPACDIDSDSFGPARLSAGPNWNAAFAIIVIAAFLTAAVPASAQRVLGIDVSAHQGDISTANWATLKRATNQQVSGVYGDGRDFVFIRSSRGGTTGEDHRQGGYPSGNNTFYNLSQRYDDPYFVQNITRATAAGMLAGSYHFARLDVIASTLNSDGVTTAGVPNTGTDEADHFIQMAGPWMRPGYLLPVMDLEAGQAQRSSAELTTFCVEFSDRIYEVMGVRPLIYINGNYASYVQSWIVPAFPNIWIARWPNQTNWTAIDVQGNQPNDSLSWIYGPWDDPPLPAQPWKFWQYASTARLNGYANGTRNIDVDVAHGGFEFVKDYFVPALWMNDNDGQWTTLTNWNGGLTPVAPVPGPGQLPRVGALTLPPTRLPGSNDTVVLERPNTNITVNLTSGTHNIRKLYAREKLTINGGSLTVNYVPSWDSTTNGAEFSAPVTLNSGSLSVHTLEVDASQMFTLGSGTLTFNTINLMPDSATAARIMMSGNITLNPLSGSTATVARGNGSGSSGFIDLGAGSRTINVPNGSADIDVSIDVPIVNGALTKTGPGTMRLNTVSAYSGGTVLSAGRLLVNNTSGSGTGSGVVTVNGGILGGVGTIGGAVTVDAGGTIAPGSPSAIGRLRLNAPPTLTGTTFVRINRNGGSPVSDAIVLSSGTLAYGGTLVVSNAGAAMLGGEVFTNFIAPAYSGAFTASVMPSLNDGLNWYTGELNANGTIKVNRRPVTSPLTFSYDPPVGVQIPIASLTGNANDPDGNIVTLGSLNLTTTNGITLVTNDTFIFYSNYVSVIDRFDYTLIDGHGGSATGTVHITSSPTGRLTSIDTSGSNAVTLHFAGRPGWTYYVERSTNLVVWMTISTNIAPPSGLFDYADEFTDQTETPLNAFYRLSWSP